MNWETVLGVLTSGWSITLIGAVAAVAIKNWVHYKRAFQEAVDIPRAILKARGKDSPGGKRIVKEEYTLIGKEIVEWLQETDKLYVARKRGKR